MNQMGLLTHGIGKDNDKSTGQYVLELKEGGMFEKLLLEIKDNNFTPGKASLNQIIIKIKIVERIK